MALFYVRINNMRKFNTYFLLIIIFLSLFSAGSVLAHQPRLVSGEEITKIERPDVSQAFYGNLTGQPHFFEIKSTKEQQVYFGLLVPDLPGIDKDVSLEIYLEDELVGSLYGRNFKWQSYYEEFTDDYYFQGPETKVSLKDDALYTLKVFSPDNQGKYVLVVGQKEEFPITEVFNTILILPKIKKDFFNKPIYTAFFNKIGLFTLGPLVILILIIVLVLIPFVILKRS